MTPRRLHADGDIFKRSKAAEEARHLEGLHEAGAYALMVAQLRDVALTEEDAPEVRLQPS